MNYLVPPTGAIVGDLTGITADGLAAGWCWSPGQPHLRRAIALVADGRRLATAVCDGWSEGLLALGVGDGGHAFSVQIPRESLPEGAGIVDVRLEDIETGAVIGRSLPYAFRASAAQRQRPAPRACLDRAGEDGLISGWCWDPAEPERRMRLIVLVDGQPAGTFCADLFRGDLASAGFGDGRHAFSYLLPWSVIAAKSSAHIALRDADTGHLLPAATIFRRPSLAPIEQRLGSLERQVKRLNAHIAEDRQRAARDAAAMAAIFATIGDFFTRLGRAPPEEAALAVVPSLSGLLDSVCVQFPPLRLAVPDQPAVTLCVTTDGTLDQVYGCLRALHDAGADRLAEIIVIDDRRSPQSSLITACVQNLRVWRAGAGESLQQARNAAVLSAGRPFAAFLSARARVGKNWLPTAIASFDSMPAIAVTGAKLVGADDTIAVSALLAGEHGELDDFARAEHRRAPACDRMRRVVAVPDHAMLVRGRVFAELGGFSDAYGETAHAVVDLCLRAWEAGAEVIYQPEGEVAWDGLAPQAYGHPYVGQLRDAACLRRLAAKPFARALVLDLPADSLQQGTVPSAIAATLAALGVDVAFAMPAHFGAADARLPVLRALGVQCMTAPFATSLASVLHQADPSFDLIVATSARASLAPPVMLRECAASARLVLLSAGTPPSSGDLADAFDQTWSAAGDRTPSSWISLPDTADAACADGSAPAESVCGQEFARLAQAARPDGPLARTLRAALHDLGMRLTVPSSGT